MKICIIYKDSVKISLLSSGYFKNCTTKLYTKNGAFDSSCDEHNFSRPTFVANIVPPATAW